MSVDDSGKAIEPRSGKTDDEIALDLMKFVVTETGFGKGQGAVGFSGKTSRTPEEHAEALLTLFDRCRKLLRAPVN